MLEDKDCEVDGDLPNMQVQGPVEVGLSVTDAQSKGIASKVKGHTIGAFSFGTPPGVGYIGPCFKRWPQHVHRPRFQAPTN